MKDKKSFVLGLLFGSVIFSQAAVLANSDVLAKITSQIFYWNNEKIELEAYNINGYNYVRLRDAANIFGVNVEYYEDTNTVYLGEERKNEIGEKTVIDGKPYAKEDYSQNANQAIFDEVYTKDAYNAVRQSIEDIKEITKNTDENGYNAEYAYAHYVDESFTFNSQSESDKAMKSVLSAISGYYSFSFGYEPNLTNYYEYPGYRICKVQVHKYFEPANKATDSFIAEIENLSDREKVKKIADNISGRLQYKNENVVGINRIFTEALPVNAVCGTYADAFLYLCQRAEIPCVSVEDDIHAWNEVYVDGKWYTADISYYDVAGTDEMLLQTNYPRCDPNTAKTKFAKELLVPGSTK